MSAMKVWPYNLENDNMNMTVLTICHYIEHYPIIDIGKLLQSDKIQMNEGALQIKLCTSLKKCNRIIECAC